MERISLRFFGAAGTVTGSKYLVESDRLKVLVDCGIFQGQKEWRLKNWEDPPFHPGDVSAIILTHTHIDHIGYLPVLTKRGFRGPIYCTPATDELIKLLLVDSAHLQEEEAQFAFRHGTSKHNPPKPLYTEMDVREVLRLLQVIPRDESTEIRPGVWVKPVCAGHILGSASLTLDIGGKRITFSGDIGRYDAPILPDPRPVEIGDLLLCESTYGDRVHPDEKPKELLRRVVLEAVERRGPLIVPAFALGRTQSLLFYLSQLEKEAAIPVLPIFVDSPMAVDATKLYTTYNYDHDAGVTPRSLSTLKTTFCRSVQQSKELNGMRGTRIIISASGMVTGGRILHHLRHHLPDPDATVLFVGYQGEGTRGRTIQSGEKEVKIFGEYVPIRANVRSISGLSAHGDQTELLRWLESSTGSPAKVRIVHGEPAASEVFAQKVREKFGWKVEVAKYLEQVDV